VAGHKGGGSHAATEAIYVTLGIVLVLLSIREHFQPAKDTEKDQADSAAKGTGLSPLRYMSLGVVMTATNFTTLALFIPALREIAVSTASNADRLVAGVVLVVIATVTAWLPLLATVIAPGPAKKALSAIHDFTTKYKHQIVEVVLFVFGAYMIIKGLSKH
jgi:cadmium resistance protein CadD (predicted permease)